MMQAAKTLFEKLWENHLVNSEKDCPDVLYIDMHLVHEVTSPQAFSGLRKRGLAVRRPDRTFATIDHSVPTLSDDGSGAGRMRLADTLCAKQIEQLETNCKDFGIELFGLDHAGQGIVHIIGPELGLTQPGMTIVCGDSHTATHGAFGSLAFGIGTSEVEHVLATQCLLQYKPKTMEVVIDGRLGKGVTAKDVILALINQIGVGGGTGCVIEYRGEAIRGMSMAERMTICNMSIEAGARAGMIAPDDTTFAYLAGRPYVAQGTAFEQQVAAWKKLPTDDGAVFDKSVRLDVNNLEPMITFGTNPGMSMSISGAIPSPEKLADANQKAALEKALKYMGLQAGAPLAGQVVDVVFVGSCTNGRLEDLRQAASLLKGHKTAESTRVLVVPGSQAIKKQAEAEGLDVVFKESGAEWREPGCSMCIAMNGDGISPGQVCVSTSNRNFEGRQGSGGRTLLASPLTAAAAAITGKVTDPRTLVTD